jgi:hypothetical protein
MQLAYWFLQFDARAAPVLWLSIRGGTFTRTTAMLETILLVLLVLLLLGALPAWPHSRSWGYFPSGGLGLLLVILLVIVLMRGGI